MPSWLPRSEEPARRLRIPVSFQAKASVSERKLEIEHLELETPFLSGSLSGTYPWEGDADLWMEAEVSDLSAARAFQREMERALGGQNVLLADDWNVGGSGSALGRLRQRFPRLVFDGELAAEGLTLGTMKLGAVRAQAIVSRDYARLPALIVRTNPGGALSVEKCPKCSEAPVVVKIESITTDDKGKESRSTVFEEMIPAAEAAAMESALKGPSATGPAAT